MRKLLLWIPHHALLTRRLLFSCFFCFIGLLAKSQWMTSGTNIYNSNTGNVGIGISTPAISLHVAGHSAATNYDGSWQP